MAVNLNIQALLGAAATNGTSGTTAVQPDSNLTSSLLEKASQITQTVNASTVQAAVDRYEREDTASSEENSSATANTASGSAARAKLDVSNADKYAVTKMSAEDRAALVSQLKDEQESIQQKFLDKMTSGTIGKQYSLFQNANASLTQTSDGIWKFIASGNYTVDAETKKEAQEAISEDGYFGVKKTSQRLFDFVAGMAGGDTAKMKSLQSAVETGYKDAEKTWGGTLPQISSDTMDATRKLFEEYYKQNDESDSNG